jgi:multidrug resistance efflux pump
VRAAADHAEAVLAQRTATLASLLAKQDLQQSAIRQASADLDAKSAQADFAKVDAERYRTLALSNYGSRQNAERTSALDQQARAAVASAQAALAAAKQQLSVWRPILMGLQPPLPKRGPISKPHGSTSVTQKSARRLTAISATARHGSVPMSRKAPIC